MSWAAILSCLLVVICVMQIVMLWRIEKARREAKTEILALAAATGSLAAAAGAALAAAHMSRVQAFTFTADNDQPGVMH